MGIETGTALLIAGLIGGGASVANGVIGSNAAHDASDQQIDSANKALAFQKDVFNINQGNQAPFLHAGQRAVGRLTSLMGLGGGIGETPTQSLTSPTLGLTGPHVNNPNNTPPDRNPDGTPRTAVPRGTVPPPAAPPATAPPQLKTPVTPSPVPAPPSGPPRLKTPVSLASVGTGANAPTSGGVTVTDPTGTVHTFATQIQAQSFRQQAGIL